MDLSYAERTGEYRWSRLEGFLPHPSFILKMPEFPNSDQLLAGLAESRLCIVRVDAVVCLPDTIRLRT